MKWIAVMALGTGLQCGLVERPTEAECQSVVNEHTQKGLAPQKCQPVGPEHFVTPEKLAFIKRVGGKCDTLHDEADNPIVGGHHCEVSRRRLICRSYEK